MINSKPKKPNRKTKRSIIFFLVTLAAYPVIGIFYPEFIRQSLENFQQILLRILPILGIVFLVMFSINLWLKPNKIKKCLGTASGIKGWLYAIIGGILVSGPPYLLYPLLGDFKKHGVKDSLLAVFLYNRNVKIPFFPVMIFYFGLPLTIIVSFYIILFSILNGKLVEFFTKKSN